MKIEFCIDYGDKIVPSLQSFSPLHISCIIHFRKILDLHDEGISLRGIAARTNNSRQKVTEPLVLDEKKGLICPFAEEMTDLFIV